MLFGALRGGLGGCRRGRSRASLGLKLHRHVQGARRVLVVGLLYKGLLKLVDRSIEVSCLKKRNAKPVVQRRTPILGNVVGKPQGGAKALNRFARLKLVTADLLNQFVGDVLLPLDVLLQIV